MRQTQLRKLREEQNPVADFGTESSTSFPQVDNDRNLYVIEEKASEADENDGGAKNMCQLDKERNKNIISKGRWIGSRRMENHGGVFLRFKLAEILGTI